MKYVQIDSPTKNEKKFADFITKELEELGFDVYIDSAGDKVGSDSGNVIAKLKGNKDVEPILFSCHMDTVSPSIGIKPIIKDDIIYSDGTTILGADDKAGIATNIVTAEVNIKAEARSLNNEKLDKQTEHMVKSFEDAAKEFGAQVEFDIERMYSAFVIEENDDIVELVKKACENIGVKAYTDSTGGGSDTNIFNINGIKAVNLGLGMRKPHTLEEHISIKNLVSSGELVLEIIKSV